MKKVITSKKFASNVAVSICAQIISLAVSFILNLIVPKFIDEYQYAYWQTYILYVSYVGVLHFGLLDGIALRYSQYDYDELDKPRIRSQFRLLLVVTAFITLAFTAVSLAACKDETQIIFILVAFAVVTKNLVTYSSYTFQITNRINKYAFLVIFQRLVYGLIVIGLLITGVNDFYWYCLADLIGDIAGILLSMLLNRGLYVWGRALGVKDTFKEAKLNVSSGIILMLANWSAILIVSGAKMVVQWRWSTLLFSKVSFAFSMTNVFLTFITAISVVLFPSLKRLDSERLPEIYKDIRNIISPLLLMAIILYFPGCSLLELWLPRYTKSLPYLGILLPMIVFSSKVNLLTNNYLKAYKKERAMLLINLFSVTVGVIAFIILAYVAGSLEGLLIGIVATTILNSIMSELVVLHTIHVRVTADFFIEIAMAAGFIAIVRLIDGMVLTRWWGCLAYAGMLAVYCLLNYKKISALIKKLLRKDRKKVLAEPAGAEESENS